MYACGRNKMLVNVSKEKHSSKRRTRIYRSRESEGRNIRKGAMEKGHIGFSQME